MLPRDTYSQPTAADPVLDERIVLGLVRRHVEEFMAVWRAVRILSDIPALANRPERRSQALDSLEHLIADLG